MDLKASSRCGDNLNGEIHGRQVERDVQESSSNVRGCINQTDKPIILVIIYRSFHGKNTELGGERQVGTVRTSLIPTPADDISAIEPKIRKGIARILDSSTDRTESDGEVHRAGLGPLVGDLSSEGGFVILIQLFDRLEGRGVLSDEGALLQEDDDVHHIFFPGESFDIA